MSAIYKTVEVKLGDEVKSLKLDFATINAIENEVSLALCVHEMNLGAGKLSKMAIVLEYIYRAAGFKDVKRDDLLLDLSSVDGKKFIDLVNLVMVAAFPRQDDAAPAKKK